MKASPSTAKPLTPLSSTLRRSRPARSRCAAPCRFGAPFQCDGGTGKLIDRNVPHWIFGGGEGIIVASLREARRFGRAGLNERRVLRGQSFRLPERGMNEQTGGKRLP